MNSPHLLFRDARPAFDPHQAYYGFRSWLARAVSRRGRGDVDAAIVAEANAIGFASLVTEGFPMWFDVRPANTNNYSMANAPTGYRNATGAPQ